MFVQLKDLATELNGWKIAVMVFNKDSRNLLRAYNLGLKTFDYSIEYLIDFTLPFRPNIDKIAKDIWPADKIVTDPLAFQVMCEEAAFDAIMIFEDGYETTIQDHLGATDFVEINSFADVVKKCKNDYDNYAKWCDKAEYNFRWSIYSLRYIADYLEHQEIVTMSGYNNPLVENIGEYQSLLLFTDEYHTLPIIPDDFHQVPIRFVLGEDWGVGKTSYLLEQMAAGASGMAGDFWFNFISPQAIPPFNPATMVMARGVIANKIFQADKRNPRQPVFMKFDGRLEEFIYGFPKDRSLLLQDWYKFFDDCQFIIVHKPHPSPRMANLVAAFKEKYALSDEQLICVKMPYCGKAEML